MDYSYNYGYLREFMESHKLQKRDLLEALGCGDYVSLNKWLDGKVPVHVTAMLRFCNYYNIPMDGFFFDGDAIPCIRPALPDADSQTLPTDGYGMEGGRGRGIVETRVGTRKVTTQNQAKVVAEGIERQNDQRRLRDELLMQQEEQGNDNEEERASITYPTTTGNTSVTEHLLRLQLDHAHEMRRIEIEHHDREDQIRRECQASFDAERNRLMDIIERQNSELLSLHAQARNNRASTGYCMVRDGGDDQGD